MNMSKLAYPVALLAMLVLAADNTYRFFVEQSGLLLGTVGAIGLAFIFLIRPKKLMERLQKKPSITVGLFLFLILMILINRLL